MQWKPEDARVRHADQADDSDSCRIINRPAVPGAPEPIAGAARAHAPVPLKINDAINGIGGRVPSKKRIPEKL